VTRRTAALLLALVVTGGLVGSAGARTNDRKKPIVFVHGLSRDSASNCASTWNDMKRKFRDSGHTGSFTTVAYYRGDTNCSHWISHHGRHSRHHASGHDGNHTADTSIRHPGYHLAWTIWNHHSRHGRKVDVVAHSMGGLVTRSRSLRCSGAPPLSAQASRRGRRHAWRAARRLALVRRLRASPVRADAGGLRLPRLARAQRLGAGRQGRHGLVDLRLGRRVGSCHKVWYLPSNDIEHGDFLHDTSKRISADVYRFNCRSGSWVEDLTSHWPVRRADLAVTFGNR
jgi:hypothetical protein